MRSTVLVAGGAGFIGVNLCESLLRDKFQVICLDNLITGTQNNINSLLKNDNFSFIKHDIVKPLPSSLLRKGIDYIFHLASPASPNKKSKISYLSYPIETLMVNSYGTNNLLLLAHKIKAKLLYSSSSEVYGDAAVSPQDENYFGNVNPNGVRSVYDEGKRFGEALLMAFFRKFHTDIRIVRIFNTYGPGMRIDDGRVIVNLINQALTGKDLTIFGDGRQTRSFCFIDDMVAGLKKAMLIKAAEGEVINLGNPDEKTILDVARIIKNMTGSGSNIVFEQAAQDDPRIRKPDISKAKKILQWVPEVDILKGLEKTISYFRQLNT